MTTCIRHCLGTAVAALLVLGTAAAAHAQSAVDGFDPGAGHNVHALAVQADGKILAGGAFLTLGGGGMGMSTRNHIGRLNADGSLDTSFDPGANSGILKLAVQLDGKILAVGNFTMIGGGGTGTTPRNHIARLNPDGSIDPLFNPGANSAVYNVAVQPDGKILVAGFFTALGGGTGTTPRNHIGRLNADGSLDMSFDPGANGNVYAVALQPDGKIVVGGAFTMLGGGGTGTTTRNYLGRLNADGSLDLSFDPGASTTVWTSAVQPDGKILVAGDFTMLSGGGMGMTARNKIGRLKADGSIDPSFDPGANSTIFNLALQPDGKILAGGAFTMLGGGGTGMTSRNYIGRLNADGSLDPLFDPGANSNIYSLAVQADGKIVAGGLYTMLGGGGTGTTTRNHIARLYADGSLDANLDPGANSSVVTLAVQPDDKILVGGGFTTLGGGGMGTTTRNYIGRLEADGSLDTSFNPGANSGVIAIAVQPDGKIVVGGFFTMLGGGGMGLSMRNHIGRLNADGSLDMSFDPGANGTVFALVVQPDGKILVGGNFTMLGGGMMGMTTRNRIGRLNADGSLDMSFDPGASSTVTALALQPDGSILAGGNFTMLGGGGTGMTTRNHIGRLDAAGALDMSFDPGANSDVNVLSVQADGKILAGGFFTMLGGGGTGMTTRNRIGRLKTDGSLDLAFDPGANGLVQALAVQTDAKVLVGGGFTGLGGGTGTTLRNRIGRINEDGSVDPSFDPGASLGMIGIVYALAPQADGKIVAGGFFTMLGGGGAGTTPRNYIGRLTNTGAAVQSLGVSDGGTVVTWLRSGTGPEVQRATFESSTDASIYTPLGSGVRMTGGWKLSGLSLPINQNVYVRARGYYATGQFDGSGSIVESIRQTYVSCPAISPTLLAAGTLGVPYSTMFTASGALGFVTFGEMGALPTGITFSAGLLSGTPTQSGIFPIAVTATDSSSGCTASQNLTLAINCVMCATARSGDFDGDGKADLTVYRSSTGGWHVLKSSANYTSSASYSWGLSTDTPVPGDYDGDGKIDPAIYRPSTGLWAVLKSSTNYTTSFTVSWGLSTDAPVPGDFDGDGKTDPAVYRPSTGFWYVLKSSTGYTTSFGVAWGLSTDLPMQGDYDGDGKTDPAVFRPSTGGWYNLNSTTNFTTSSGHSWGLSTDVAVPGDYDGDGKIDPAVFRPSTGGWYVLKSITNYTTSFGVLWGLSTDVPVPGDFDGDHKTDPAVFRPSTGGWYILKSSTNYTTSTGLSWGLSTDTPILKRP